MRVLVIFLLLTPFICFSQVSDITIELIDVTGENELEKEYAIVKIGHRKEKQVLVGIGKSSFVYNPYKIEDLKSLEDTLFIYHSDYHIDSLPISQHSFEFVSAPSYPSYSTSLNNFIHVKVPARLYYNYYYEHKYDIARSYKTKNDSVNLRVFCKGFGDNPEILLQLGKDKKQYHLKRKVKYSNNYYLDLPYDSLNNGVFEVRYKNKKDSFPFYAKEWYQTQFLLSETNQVPHKRELKLIDSYFALADKSQSKVNSIKNRYEKRIDILWREIDSLRSILNNKKYEYVPPPQPEKSEEIIDGIFVSDAQPKEGFDAFFRSLKWIFHGEDIKYCGNVTLKLEISKDGSVESDILHAKKGLDYYKLRKDIESRRWVAAKRRGKPISQTVIISLNFSPDEKSLSQIKKFEPKKGMVSISQKDKRLKLELGQKAFYQIRVHGSVGSWANFNLSDNEVIKQSDYHFAYDRIQIRGETGGDSGIKTHVFQALKKGKTKLIVYKTFRGKVESKRVVKVVVR